MPQRVTTNAIVYEVIPIEMRAAALVSLQTRFLVAHSSHPCQHKCWRESQENPDKLGTVFVGKTFIRGVGEVLHLIMAYENAHRVAPGRPRHEYAAISAVKREEITCCQNDVAGGIPF